MDNNQFTNTQGLRELPQDDRDFALGGVFGNIDINSVPVSGFVVIDPLFIKDQGDTDYCSAYAVTSVSEDQEFTELLPEYQFFRTKQIAGNPEDWGADLRSACKSAVKFGSLPIVMNKKGLTRDQVLDKDNWEEYYLFEAMKYRKGSYFSVNGPYDTFDNMRLALWQHRNDKCTIVTGAKWRYQWINAPGGVIQKDDFEGGFGHAFKIFGQKIINDELHLMAQLSNGVNVGDNGIFYFSREVVNRELGKYGAFMFKDMAREEAEYYLSNDFIVSTPWYSKLWSIISNFLK